MKFQKSRLHFRCEHCGKDLKADVANAGRQARCTTCGKSVRIPGERANSPESTADLDALPSVRPPLEETDVDVEPLDQELERSSWDASSGPASLYLGAVGLVLFLAVMVGASFVLSVGRLGAIVLMVMTLGGLLLSWRGWRLARAAKEHARATGQGLGYADAARWSHGLLAANYLCLLLVGVVVLFSGEVLKLSGGKSGVGDLNLGGLLKTLQNTQGEVDKLVDEINRR